MADNRREIGMSSKKYIISAQLFLPAPTTNLCVTVSDPFSRPSVATFFEMNNTQLAGERL